MIHRSRKKILEQIADYIGEKINQQETVHLNFICTHNSRRSHMAQVWSYVAAIEYGVRNINFYSGGTEATAVFPSVIETLRGQGLDVHSISSGNNPVYFVKAHPNSSPLILFSKEYDHVFNPSADFVAIMTCDDADQNCPIVIGAEKRFALTYEDPKKFDHSDVAKKKYLERSEQIKSEMFYLFSMIKT